MNRPSADTSSEPLLSHAYGDPHRIMNIFTQFIIVTILGLGAGIIFELSRNNIVAAIMLGLSVVPVAASLSFVRRKRFEPTAIFLALILIGLITVVATKGQGIRQISVLAYPAVLIVASLVIRKRVMAFLTLYNIACIAWLIFGEYYGVYTPAVARRSTPADFLIAAIVLGLTAFMVRLLTETLFQNNLRMHRELVERKRVEDELHISLEKYRVLFESFPLGITITDKSGKIIEANRESERLLGISPSKQLERTYDSQEWQIVRTDGTPMPATEFASVRALQENRLIDNVEMGIIKDKGEITWINVTAAPIPLADYGVAIAYGDITGRKRAEEVLRNSEVQYRLLFQNNPNPMWVYDQETYAFLAVNDEAVRRYGYTRDEFLAMTIKDIRPPEDIPELEQEISHLPAGFNQSRIWRHRKKDGTIIFVEITSHWSEFAGRRVRIVLANDVTERKHVEDELKKSEERYRAVVESLTEFIVRWKSNGMRTFANEAYRRFYGLTEEQALSSSFLPLVAEEDRAAVQAKVARLLSGNVPSETEIHRVIKPDGSIGWQEWVDTAIYNESGQIVEFQSVGRDITEHKRAEETLQKRYKELTAVYKASQRLQKLLTPERLAQEVIEVLENTLEYTYSAVLLVDHSSGTLEPFALSKQKKGTGFLDADRSYIRSKGVRLGTGITGWVAEHGESVRLGDVSTDSRYLSLRKDVRSELCVPLRLQDQIIGVINVESTQANAYTEEDQQLLETVAIQISVAIQNSRLVEDLRLSRQRLAELSRRLVEAYETERRAIGRELHDQFGQMLTAMKITLELARELPADAAAKRIGQAWDLTNDLLNRVSRLSLELRPSMLDDLGLIPALLWHVNNFQEQIGIQVDFKHSNVEGKRFTSGIETTAYRIAQEALTNVARHARATRAQLEVRAGGGWMEIRIEDDGVGFDPESALSENRGLSGMRERAQLVGGTFQVESERGKGTMIQIQLPLQEDRA